MCDDILEHRLDLFRFLDILSNFICERGWEPFVLTCVLRSVSTCVPTCVLLLAACLLLAAGCWLLADACCLLAAPATAVAATAATCRRCDDDVVVNVAAVRHLVRKALGDGAAVRGQH